MISKVAVSRVQTGERVGDDVQRVGQRTATNLNQIPFSVGVWKRAVSLSAAPTTVAHGLGRVPQGFFATSAKAVPYDEAQAKRLWLDRLINGASLTSLTNPAGNFTVGCKFTALTTRECIGVRFAGYNGGAARTYTASLWIDAGSTLVNSASVALAANATRWAVALFTKPTVLVAGTAYVVGTYHSTGGNYIRSNIDTLAGVVPVTWGADITLTNLNAWSAGNAKPASTSATESYWAEPVLSDRRAIAVERSSLTPADPNNQLSLVTSAPAVCDLWIY